MTGGPLRPVRYRGGKSAFSRGGAGRWIAAQLPPVGSFKRYVEPFAGMLGVLLARPAAPSEAVNDLDGAVYCFWRSVRDHPEELHRLLLATPTVCPRTLDEARRVLDDAEAPTVRRGWALAAACHMARGAPRVGVIEHHALAKGDTPLAPFTRVAAALAPLTERLRSVQLHNRCALEVISMLDHSSTVFYIDPPYPGTGGGYGATVDQAALTELLLGLKGRAAVSGYEGDRRELDAAGWRRSSLRVQAAGAGMGRAARVECLWMNFEPPAAQQRLWGGGGVGWGG